jgi:RNA polymerase sigma factor (TIGR02999 family)
VGTLVEPRAELALARAAVEPDEEGAGREAAEGVESGHGDETTWHRKPESAIGGSGHGLVSPRETGKLAVSPHSQPDPRRQEDRSGPAMSTEEESGGHEITRLLQAAREGAPGALDRLVPLVYDDLRRVAGRQLGHEFVERTLNPTALVHEAYLKLARGGALAATDRAHFLAIAARAMRQVLVDQARERKAAKRGGGDWDRTTLTDGAWVAEFRPDELLALEEALEELEPRQRQVVEYRFFGGMEDKEIATVLGVSERTVHRDWVKARAWLYRRYYGEPAT